MKNCSALPRAAVPPALKHCGPSHPLAMACVILSGLPQRTKASPSGPRLRPPTPHRIAGRGLRLCHRECCL